MKTEEKDAGRVVESRTVYQGRIIRLEVRTLDLGDGKPVRREIVHHPGAAAILAELPDGRFLWVSQYRHAVDARLLEVPAGTLEPGEDPAVCARREVEEETGRPVEALTAFGPIWASPGFMCEKLYLFHARLGATAGPQKLDAEERIETVALTADEVERRIASGAIADGKSLACWLRYRLQRSTG